MTAPVTGPFETSAEAMAHPAVRAIYDAMHASLRRGVGEEKNLCLLEGACEAAGLTLGGYDRRILRWLAGWEAQICAVVAGLITRAAGHALIAEQRATILDALEVAADELRDRAANCGDCNAHPAELCTTCESRLSRAEGFDRAALALGGAR